MKTKTARAVVATFFLSVACSALFFGSSARACTDFCWSQADTVLAGRSLDSPYNGNLGMLVVPATAGAHGWVCFGPFDDPGVDGMNDQGLFVGEADVPATYTNTTTSTRQPADIQRYVCGLLDNCASVDEAIRWCEQQPTPCIDGWVHRDSQGNCTFTTGSHVMVADRSGDSVVFEWPQGKLKTTRKQGRYQLMTNFLLSNTNAGGYPCPRYIADSRILDKAAEPTLKTCRQVLETTSVGTTRYSLIYDLTHGDVQVYLRRGFEDSKTIHLADELQKGRHEFDLDAWFGRPKPEPLSPPPVIAPSTIPASEILRRALAARGGENVVAKILSLHAKGTVDLDLAFWSPSPADYIAMRPNRYRAVVGVSVPDGANLGQYAQGFDGHTGWSCGPDGSCQILQGRAEEEEQDKAAFFGWYDEPANYKTVECLGKAQFDGKLCYALKVVTQTQHEYFHYYDATNFLLAGIFARATTENGPSWVKSTFGDYRKFDGFKLPTRIVSQRDQEPVFYRLRVSSVEINRVKESELRMASETTSPKH